MEPPLVESIMEAIVFAGSSQPKQAPMGTKRLAKSKKTFSICAQINSTLHEDWPNPEKIFTPPKLATVVDLAISVLNNYRTVPVEDFPCCKDSVNRCFEAFLKASFTFAGPALQYWIN